jgi:lysosomal acid phosphatase
LRSLERIAFNGDPLQFLLIESTYQPFISLMHMTELVNGHPELEGVRKFDDISDLDILIFTYVEK